MLFPFRDGRLRALGVSSQTRLTSLPDVPPIAEAANTPDFEAVSWHMLVVRAGPPRPSSHGCTTK